MDFPLCTKGAVAQAVTHRHQVKVTIYPFPVNEEGEKCRFRAEYFTKFPYLDAYGGAQAGTAPLLFILVLEV